MIQEPDPSLVAHYRTLETATLERLVTELPVAGVLERCEITRNVAAIRTVLDERRSLPSPPADAGLAEHEAG